ncbi:unnamed protein product, partial [Rotaria sp. Silwood2]
MATSQSSVEETSVVRFNIDGIQHRIEFALSGNAAALRTKLKERYDLSNKTCFLDNKHCKLHIDDENSTNISQLLTQDNFVQLSTEAKTPTELPVPQRTTKLPERKIDLKCTEPINQSTKTCFHKIEIPVSTPKSSENKIILATDLGSDMWKKIFDNNNLLYGIRMDKSIPERAFDPIFKFKSSNDVHPKFQHNDESYIRAYMKDKEMQSSFVSSEFFDNESEFSSHFISLGINGEYLKNKSKANTQRTVYFTCCYNIHRAIVQLHSSYLELTPAFIEAIDAVLSIGTQREQIMKLQKVLLEYGHIYPRRVVLGGHLYYTKMDSVRNKAEEEEKRLKVEASFATSIFKPAPVHVGGEFANKLENKFFEQTSIQTYKAVGGDTLMVRDPTQWTSTVADPSLWRIIQQDEYQS